MKLSTISTTSNGLWTQQQIKRFAIQLFWYCFLAYVCSYIGRKNFSACLPEMIEEGFLTKTVGGYITTAYMLVYGTGQLVNGALGSRYKPVYMIGVGLFGAAGCNFLMGIMPSAMPMPIIWAANGLFHSMLWAPIIRVFTDQIPDEQRLSAGANIGASCSVGAILAFVIPAVMLKFYSWRCVFFVSSLILFLSFVIWVLGNHHLRKYLRLMDVVCTNERTRLFAQTSTAGDGVAESTKPRKYSLLSIMLATGIWVVFFALLCNGALRDGVESWAPTFFKEQFGISSSKAALMSVVIPIISISGTYTSNWLNNRYIKNELYTACLMFVIASVAVLACYFMRHTNVLICAVFVALSTAAMWGANHMFLTQLPYHFATYGLSAALTGLLNGFIYFSSALSSGLYGIIADRIGNWDVIIRIWFISGVAGIFFSYIAGKSWKKKRALTDEGKLFS